MTYMILYVYIPRQSRVVLCLQTPFEHIFPVDEVCSLIKAGWDDRLEKLFLSPDCQCKSTWVRGSSRRSRPGVWIQGNITQLARLILKVLLKSLCQPQAPQPQSFSCSRSVVSPETGRETVNVQQKRPILLIQTSEFLIFDPVRPRSSVDMKTFCMIQRIVRAPRDQVPIIPSSIRVCN